ncbi:MAG: hypothetical protein E7458_09115, partial [Ruminococcaceae bacterium]|nr:hypothetical protein [Oscillospiraceae bacterium]
MQIQNHSNASEEARLWFLFSRFRELEAYAACIRRIHELFQEVALSSTAFLALRGQIAELIQSDVFRALEAFVKGFRLDVDQVKSITVGINLDASLNPESVALVSVNSQKYKSQTFISSVSNVFEKKEFQDLLLPAKLHQMSQDRQDHLLYVVYQDVERYVKPLARTLSDSLNRFTSICTNTLTYLIPELLFYVRFAEFYHEIRALSMPVCFPSIREKALRETDIEGVYHLNLMLHMLERGQAPQQE